MVCSVGSTIWIATETGTIQVFCALTYKPLALGRLICHRYILRILHSPVCNSVLIALTDGSVYSYHDNITSYTKSISPTDVPVFFPTAPAGAVIRELIPSSNHFTGDTTIHCLAALISHRQRRYSEEVITFKNSEGGHCNNFAGY